MFLYRDSGFLCSGSELGRETRPAQRATPQLRRRARKELGAACGGRLAQLQALTLAIANLAVLTALLGQRLTADQPVGETRMACCNSDSCGEGSSRWSSLQSHSVRRPPVENPDTEPGNQTPTGLDAGSWTPAPLRTGAAPADAGAASSHLRESNSRPIHYE